MAVSNSDRVGKALELLRDGLAPFVERECRAMLGEDWVSKMAQVSTPSGRAPRAVSATDTQFLLKAMWDGWNQIFGRTLGRTVRTLVSELIEVRNKWAHQESFTTDGAYRALDSIQLLLQGISAEQAVEVERQKAELLRRKFDEQAKREKKKSAATAIEGQEVAGLKPWREVITPHPDVASGRYQQAEFAADLSQVHRGEGSDEYKDPVEFFRRTYLTEGLTELLTRAIQRVEGTGGVPVIDLQTNFGGGKTHSLIALFHLLSGADASKIPGLEPVLKSAEIEFIPRANRAVIVGTMISPGKIHEKPDGTRVHTLWGEIAWQLGGAKGYQLVAEADKTATSPGDDLRRVLEEYSPCLILIDEWVAYARQLYGKDDLPAGTFDTHFTFAQTLTEAASAVNGALVVISIPASEPSRGGGASEIEVGGEGGKEALRRLTNVVHRTDAPWRPASAEESFEIVRRRLFQAMEGEETFQARDTTAQRFADMYRTQPTEFPGKCREGDYEGRLRDAYPIHPELFDRLYEDWGSLERFQRTRGVLRLMAAVIHTLWERQDSAPLIMPGNVPIDDTEVFSELTRYLEDNWRPVIEAEVDGPNALSLQLDRSNPRFGQRSAVRRVARTLYLGSAPTVGAANQGLEDTEIMLGCVLPSESPGTFGDALRRLGSEAVHLYEDGRRYWFSLRQSIASVARGRAAQFKTDELHEEIRKRLLEERNSRGEFAGIHVVPTDTAEVPDDLEARLVILDPENPHSSKTEESPARGLASEFLERRGGSPRLYKNTLVFLAADRARLEDLENAVREYQAWKSIVDEVEILDLAASDFNKAKARMAQATQTVDQRMLETYTWMLTPSQKKDSTDITWDETKVTGQGPLAVRAAKRLVSDEGLINQFSAVRLRLELDRIPLWEGDHVNCRKLWEHFAQYLYLPRLRDRRVLEVAAADGVAMLTWRQDGFAYAEGFSEGEGRYLGLRAGQNVTVNFDGNSVLVKPAVAAEQLEKEAPGPLPSGVVVDEPGPEDGEASGEKKAGLLKRFHGSVRLDPVRTGRDASEVAEHVIKHLASLVNSDVEIRLEIDASIPDGAPEQVVRTVTENARTLKFDNFGFEEQ